MMKIFYKISKVLLAVVLLFVYSCNEETTPSLYDLPAGGQPTPVISSIDPSNSALAGVTVVTITGSNFYPFASGNFVYFNGVKANVLSFTPTQLKVLAPNVVADTVFVKVAAYKSMDFSNLYQYKLVTAQEEYYKFDPSNAQIPYAFIFNPNGDMLVSLFSNATNPFGIKKILPVPFDERTLLDYIPMGNTQKWDCLKFGPGSQLYGSRTVNAIWKLDEGVAPASPWAIATGSLLKDFDFDVNNNIWAVGTANKIYRIDQNKVSTSFAVSGTFRSARVFNNNLYYAGAKGTTEGVWKIPILSNGDLDLTSEELYFDLSSAYPGNQALAITFAADGDLLLGTNKDPDPIIVVHPNKNAEVLYPGVIPASKAIYMYWPAGSTSFYFTREEKKDPTGKIIYSQSILRVEMQKNGAPYYGL